LASNNFERIFQKTFSLIDGNSIFVMAVVPCEIDKVRNSWPQCLLFDTYSWLHKGEGGVFGESMFQMRFICQKVQKRRIYRRLQCYDCL